MENDTVKRRELAWKNVTSKVQDVLFPLMQPTNTEQKLLLQVPDNIESASASVSVSNPDDIVMADSTKIKEINMSSSDHIVPERLRLEHAIKAYASAQKKIAKYIGPSP